jgi:hypothetical protein
MGAQGASQPKTAVPARADRFEEVHELIRGHRVDLLRTFQVRRR